MEVTKTKLDGCVIIKPKVFGDHRGFFKETFQADRYKEAGLVLPFVQDNHSRSTQGVLRGLHYQKTKPQGKLVSCSAGEVFDVAVDLRAGSSTYGQWEGVILSGDNHIQFYVPPGFAHGFVVLSDTADFQYKCTDYYDPSDEGGLIWNDPDVGIEWPLGDIEPKLSEKDMILPKLNELG
jgi:dTDP-4-dehydrorhamnose 3,5-epimerase